MACVRSLETLRQLFKSEIVVELSQIAESLGEVSLMTAFRYLKRVPYRRSYNHNGRYYCWHEPSQYDRFGLWSWGDIHFSVDGSLRKTVRRLVQELKAGATHRELQERLKVRVHNTLLDLLRHREVGRERLGPVYVYLHIDPQIRDAQRQHRQDWLDAQEAATAAHPVEVTDQVVIQVLLTLLRHPAAKVADVVRYLRGFVPPITFAQVSVVFERYELDTLDQKGGAWNC